MIWLYFVDFTGLYIKVSDNLMTYIGIVNTLSAYQKHGRRIVNTKQ